MTLAFRSYRRFRDVVGFIGGRPTFSFDPLRTDQKSIEQVFSYLVPLYHQAENRVFEDGHPVFDENGRAGTEFTNIHHYGHGYDLPSEEKQKADHDRMCREAYLIPREKGDPWVPPLAEEPPPPWKPWVAPKEPLEPWQELQPKTVEVDANAVERDLFERGGVLGTAKNIFDRDLSKPVAAGSAWSSSSSEPDPSADILKGVPPEVLDPVAYWMDREYPQSKNKS